MPICIIYSEMLSQLWQFKFRRFERTVIQFVAISRAVTNVTVLFWLLYLGFVSLSN